MTNLTPDSRRCSTPGSPARVLALIVATARQLVARVFFLLALRLAIGWHFLFEGLHKVNSYLVGPTETNRPFTSEPYFRNAPGPARGRTCGSSSATRPRPSRTKVKADEGDRAAGVRNLSVAEQGRGLPGGGRRSSWTTWRRRPWRR